MVANGDFEADSVAANTEAGSVDITGWSESGPTTAYREWIRDDADHGAPFGGAGGAGIAENNNWAAFSGNASGALYIHQTIGTLSAGIGIIKVAGVTSDRGDRAGTGRHAAIVQVGLWYDNGTAMTGDGTGLHDTTGLTEIGTMTVGASVGGDFTDINGNAPDIDLTTLDPAGQNLSEAWEMDFDLAGTGIGPGATVHLQFQYYDASTESRSEAFFDNIAVSEVVPEPSVALLGGLGLLGLLRRRRA